jgi:hypothetical protein
VEHLACIVAPPTTVALLRRTSGTTALSSSTLALKGKSGLGLSSQLMPLLRPLLLTRPTLCCRCQTARQSRRRTRPRMAHLLSRPPRQVFSYTDPPTIFSIRLGVLCVVLRVGTDPPTICSILLGVLYVILRVGADDPSRPRRPRIGTRPLRRRSSHGQQPSRVDERVERLCPPQHRQFARRHDSEPARPYRTRQSTEKASRHCSAVERYVGCCPLLSCCRLLALAVPSFELSHLPLARLARPKAGAGVRECGRSGSPLIFLS